MIKLRSIALALALAGCGGEHGTLTVSIAVPSGTGNDPFLNAATVNIQVGSPALAQATATVSGGHFSTSLKFTLKSGTAGAVMVQALAADGKTVVGRGQSPTMTMSASDTSITVWVGKPGYVGLSGQTLSQDSGRGRNAMAACLIPAVGALIAGGIGPTGAPVTDAEIYDEFQHLLDTATPLPTGRMGAVAFGVTEADSDTGAALLAAGGTPALTQDLLNFDPSAASGGAWQILASNANLALFRPASIVLSNGSWLITGGLDQSDGTGNPVKTAALVAASGSSVTAPSPMNTARSGHAMIAGSFGNQDGALIFGGTSDSTAPAEQFVLSNNSFLPVAPTGIAGMTGPSFATISPLSNGNVVIAGGAVGGTSVASLIVVTPATLVAEVSSVQLPTPRSHHVALVGGGEIVLCGGLDDQGNVLTTCDVLDDTTLAPVTSRTVTLSGPRYDLQAVTLDTGDFLLVGGISDNAGTPATEIELYTTIK